MGNEKRVDARICFDYDVSFDLVKWNDDFSGALENPQKARAIDLSESGICIKFDKELAHHVVQHLLNGTKKIRMAIKLPESEQAIVVFARLVWSNDPQKLANKDHCGCTFVDLPEIKRYHLRKLVNQTIVAQQSNDT